MGDGKKELIPDDCPDQCRYRPYYLHFCVRGLKRGQCVASNKVRDRKDVGRSKGPTKRDPK